MGKKNFTIQCATCKKEVVVHWYHTNAPLCGCICDECEKAVAEEEIWVQVPVTTLERLMSAAWLWSSEGNEAEADIKNLRSACAQVQKIIQSGRHQS